MGREIMGSHNSRQQDIIISPTLCKKQETLSESGWVAQLLYGAVKSLRIVQQCGAGGSRRSPDPDRLGERRERLTRSLLSLTSQMRETCSSIPQSKACEPRFSARKSSSRRNKKESDSTSQAHDSRVIIPGRHWRILSKDSLCYSSISV